ncbi:MAG TPA: Ig-like domain-containing protein, partial [Armatimonadota bacterium]|nr:Ig-like domain-containing protein [Armatimonadota bacterium]
ATNQVVNTISTDGFPYAIAFSPGGNRAYVSSFQDSRLLVIDTQTGQQIDALGVGGGPAQLAVSPDGRRVYVPSAGGPDVYVIDTATHTIVTGIATGAGPHSVALTPDGTKAYVPNYDGGTISIIDTTNNRVITNLGSYDHPTTAAVSPNGDVVYVNVTNEDRVVVISTTTNAEVGSIRVGDNPFGLKFSPDGTRAYTVNALDRTISVIDTTTRTVIDTIALDVAAGFPQLLALTPDGSKAYVTGFGDQFAPGSVQAVDLTTKTVTATIGVGLVPIGVAVQPLPGTIPPVSGNDAFTTVEDTPLRIAAPGVLGNDVDPEGEPLTALLVSGVAHGTLTLNRDGSFLYTPDPDYSGLDGFTYRASDGALAGNPATVTLTVSAVNDAPAAAGESYRTSEDAPLTITAPGVLGNDTDRDGDVLTAVLETGPAHGTLQLQGNGAFTYTPSADFSGTDSFTYRASDGRLTSSPVTVTLTVDAVNDAPTARNDQYAAPRATPLTVAAPGVLANDGDAEGAALTATLESSPTNGALTLRPDGSFTYRPRVGFSGPDTFTYRASDGSSPGSLATVTLTVNAAFPPSTSNARVSGRGAVTVAGGRGTFRFSVTERGGRVRGKLTYRESAPNRSVRRGTILAVVVNGNQARLFGRATLASRETV